MADHEHPDATSSPCHSDVSKTGDDDFECPSSVEAQADSSDYGFDGDLDFSTPSFPLSNNLVENGPDHNPLAGLFDPLDEQVESVKSGNAVAGICGFHNFANTCYMNSGLQCLLATPTVVKYFTEIYANCKKSDVGLTKYFVSLLQSVWTGEYGLLKPVQFKETLASKHPQFHGSQQHDCQEFLALLLDTLHEELRSEQNANLVHQSDCGTSLELHTPHSTEKSAQLSIEWLSGHSSFDGISAGQAGPKKSLMTASGSPNLSPIGSPKSYDSHSSVEDKVTSAIRQYPIPKEVKSEEFAAKSYTTILNGGCEGPSLASDLNGNGHAAEVESMGSDSTSFGGEEDTHSNLIAPDSLKRSHPSMMVRFSDVTATMTTAQSTSTITTTITTTTTTTGCSTSCGAGIADSNSIGPDFSNNATKNKNVSGGNGAVTLSDYFKDSKTLNVNVLADRDNDMNSEISFDSDKFSKLDKIRPKETIDNLASGNNEYPYRRLMMLMTATSTSTETATPLTTMAATGSINAKRMSNEEMCSTENSNDALGCCSSSSSSEVSHAFSMDNTCDCNAIKRIRLDSLDKEKNLQLERERLQARGGSNNSNNSAPTSSYSDNVSADPTRLKEAVEADRFWEKYLAANDTVVARTFQGQFKNTVVCSVCGYVSVSFEPFMYLPVPLPNAHILQLPVTLVSGQPVGTTPIKILLSMTYMDNVAKLKETTRQNFAQYCGDKIVVAEVWDHCITRLVEDWTLLKHLKDDRDIYIVCVNEAPLSASSASSASSTTSTCECVMDLSVKNGCSESEAVMQVDDATMEGSNASGMVECHSCVICMDDIPVNQLRQHNACDCIICQPCLERTVEYYQQEKNGDVNDFDQGQLVTNTSADERKTGVVKCPGCRQEADPLSEFVLISQVGNSKPKLRHFTLPVLCRARVSDGVHEVGTSRPRFTNFGHPSLVHLSNRITGQQLYKLLEPSLPPALKSVSFEMVLVNAQGKSCSRCIFSRHCVGCIRLRADDASTEYLLQPSDSIALSFGPESLSEQQMHMACSVRHDASCINSSKLPDKLSLNDCLAAFSEEELLDESNPWYCPICRKRQCATKTLTMWRLPDFLIIYLKRFVFMDKAIGAVKLEKPVQFDVNGFDVTPFLSGPLQSDSRLVYNLYSCVCHFGSVGGGHYTSFCRHIPTGEWNYFDDGSVTEGKAPDQAPEHYSSAYILFYQRAGCHTDDKLLLSRRQRSAAAAALTMAHISGQNSEATGVLPPDLADNEEQHSQEPQSEVLDEGSEGRFLKTDAARSTFPSLRSEQRKSSCSPAASAEGSEEDDVRGPDLSLLIRSLDTPPPS